MAQWGGRWFGGLRQLGVLATIVVSAALLGFTVAAAQAETVVHVYDIQVTGVLHAPSSLPSKPPQFVFSETSKWTETYKNVQLELVTSESGESMIGMRMEGEGKVTGSIKLFFSGPHIRSCPLHTNRPEPGHVSLLGQPASERRPGAPGYELTLGIGTGRSTARSALRSPNCSYFEGNWAKFTGTRVEPGGGKATGLINTRNEVFTLKFPTPQQPGQLDFPLNRLYAGEGFVLNLRGKSKNQSGVGMNEGTARITFIPRPS